MHFEFEVGVLDAYEDRGWTGGSNIQAAEPDATQIAAALAAYNATVDGEVQTLKVKAVTDYTVDVGTLGEHDVERTGVVVLLDPATLKKHPIEFKSISQSMIEKAGLGSQPKVSAAGVANAKTFLFQLSGETIPIASMKVVRNYVTGQRS